MRFSFWSAMFLCWALVTCSAQAQIVRNQLPLVTNTDPQADKLYSDILIDLNAGEEVRAQAGIESLRDRFADQLVSVESHRQLNAGLLADLLSSANGQEANLPGVRQTGPSDTGFALWRQMLNGNVNRDELLLRGDQFWISGDVKRAVLYWRATADLSLQAEFPISSLPRQSGATSSAALQRLIIAEIFSGASRSAKESIKLFRQLHPEQEGRLGGRSGNIALLLEQLVNESPDTNLLEVQYPSFQFELSKHDWKVSLTSERDSRNSYVSTSDNMVIVADTSGVRALNAHTGKSQWSVSEDDLGYLLEFTPSASVRETSPLATGEFQVIDNSLIVRSGKVMIDGQFESDVSRQSRLTRFNLTAQGRIEWTVTPKEIPIGNQFAERIFSGAPLVEQHKIYIPLRSGAPEFRLQIACFQLESGDHLWTTDIGDTYQGEQFAKLMFEDQLTIAEGCLLWGVDHSVVGCIETNTGNLIWISGVEPLTEKFTSEKPFRTNVVVEENRVITTTPNGIASYNLFTGKRQWELFLKDSPDQLLGVVDGLILFSTPRLGAIDLRTGNLKWQSKFGLCPFPRKAMLIGRTVLCPTNDGEIMTFDAIRGRLLQRDSFMELTNQTPQKIQFTEDRLFVEGPQSLSSYLIRSKIN